jgi:molybdopterin-guanine dinucleotide biosynthesis protein A
MSLYALILAGGQGSRLGLIRKDQVRINGISLLDRMVGHFSAAGANVLVSVGREISLRRDDAVVLPDPELPIGGPMAGLVAAVAHLESHGSRDLLVTTAVDTPFLPDDFVRRLVAALDGGALAAEAGWRGNLYPTNAIWRVSALADLLRLAREGTAPNSPKALLAKLEAPIVDWSDTHDEDPFANLNTLDDLVALARRAARMEP